MTMPEKCGPPIFRARLDYSNGRWSEIEVEAETLEEAKAIALRAVGLNPSVEKQELIRRLRRVPWRRDMEFGI